METIAYAEGECVAAVEAVVTVAGTKDGSSESEKRVQRLAKCRAYYRQHKDQCYAANKARHAERMKDPEYRKKCSEKSKEHYYKRGKSQREERFKDPEYKKKYLAKCRAYYQAHKEEINTDERRKRYRERYSDPEHREKYSAKSKEYYILHREEILEKKKKHRKLQSENLDNKIKVIEKRIQKRLEYIDNLKKELQDLNNMYNQQK